MSAVLPVAFGALAGVVGNLPVVYMLGLGLRSDARATVANGLAAVLLSFMAGSAFVLAAWLVAPGGFVAFALGFVASLACLWSFASVAAWRHANGKTATGDREKEANGRH